MPYPIFKIAVVSSFLTASGVIHAQIDPYKPASDSSSRGQVAAPTQVMPGQAQGFNPQPEPPGDKSARGKVKPGQAQGFNPQPEPPGDKKGPGSVGAPSAQIGGVKQ